MKKKIPGILKEFNEKRKRLASKAEEAPKDEEREELAAAEAERIRLKEEEKARQEAEEAERMLRKAKEEAEALSYADLHRLIERKGKLKIARHVDLRAETFTEIPTALTRNCKCFLLTLLIFS